MEIKYCDKCGLRLSERELTEIRDANAESKEFFCNACAGRVQKKKSARNIPAAELKPPAAAPLPIPRTSHKSYLVAAAAIATVACAASLFIYSRIAASPPDATKNTQTSGVIPGAAPTAAASLEKIPSQPKNDIQGKVESQAPALARSSKEPAPTPIHAPPIRAEKSEPKANPAVKMTEKKNLDPGEFDSVLKKAGELASTDKYSAAKALLDDLKARYGESKAWAEKQTDWDTAQKTLQQQLNDFNESAEDAQQQAAKSTNAAALDKLEAEWRPHAGIPNEPCSRKAQIVVNAIQKRRQTLLDETLEKDRAEITQIIETAEGALKENRSAKVLEPVLKSLEDAETRLVPNHRLAESLSERLATARADILMLNRGDYACFQTSVRNIGGGVEISYDFSNKEQFDAWILDAPKPKSGKAAGHAELEGKSILLKGYGEWNAKLRTAPVIKLPVPCEAENWMVEADVSGLSLDDGKTHASAGLLVWDGSAALMRLGIEEVKGNADAIGEASFNEGRGQTHPTGVGGLHETLRLRMSCTNRAVAFAVNSAAKSVILPGTVNLAFDPTFVGLYLVGAKEISARFSNIKLSVVLNKVKLKERNDSIRSALISGDRTALEKRVAEFAAKKEAEFSEEFKAASAKDDSKTILDVCRRWVEAFPDNPNNFQRYTVQLLTCKDETFRDPTLALAYAQKAVNIAPNSAVYKDTLALALSHNDQLAEAVETERKAVEMMGSKDSPARKEYQVRLKEYEALLSPPKTPAGTAQPANPAGQVQALPPSGQGVFLASLNETEVKGRFAKHLGNTYKVVGKLTPNGILTVPVAKGQAHAAYGLGKKFSTFTGTVALADTRIIKSILTFKIIGDAKVLWTSTSVTAPGNPQPFNIDVTGVQKLELDVECTGPNDACAAIWNEPLLLVK